MKKLYVAYGSNLNRSQMKYRCPTSKLIGTGILKNYELQFKGHPHSAFATVASKDGASVPVGIWELLPGDEQRLDLYEGYPNHYFKQTVPVTVNGTEMTAMIYIMCLNREFGRPSPGYYQAVRQGYRDCGLDTAILDRAVETSAQEYDRMHGYSEPPTEWDMDW